MYFLSAIEDEFDFALGKQTPAFLKKCVCYIRKIANIERFVKIPEMGKYMDITGTEPRIIRDPEAQEKLIKLRDEFIPTIVASSNLRVYTSVTHCDMKLGYSQEIENHYIEGLGKQFYEDMIDIIQATVQQNFDTEKIPYSAFFISICAKVLIFVLANSFQISQNKDRIIQEGSLCH